MKIKHILRLLISIIFASHTSACLALGLGDATLKSYLGESLTVKLNVTDVEKSPDASCFTITDVSDSPAFNKAFSTVSSRGEGFLLTVTTQSIISEPILNLRVSYNCEPQLHRDYVLLLDPPAIQSGIANTPPTISTATTTTKQASNNSKSTTSAEVSSESSNNLSSGEANHQLENTGNYTPPAKAKRKPRQRHASTPSSSDNKVMDANAGKQQDKTKQTPTASEASVTAKPETSNKPRLSISSGNLTADASGAQQNLSLQFEKQLDLNRTPPTNKPSSTELQDEVTMISNRLAHLEEQIIKLQAQNTALKKEAEQAKNALAEQQMSWFNYAWVVGVVLLALAALEWLRRTIMTKRMIKQEQNWFKTEEEDAGNQHIPLVAAIEPITDDEADNHSNATDNFFDNQDTPVASTRSVTSAPTENIHDAHDNVIDNAEVFIQHERPQLAIQLLQNHLNDFPNESPEIWLKLLSVLATEGLEAEYTATVAEANKYFNIKAPDFRDANNEDVSSIEDFPNIMARLEGVWGSPFAVKLLNDLIYDQYAQPAEGFSASNFKELFFLKNVAELLNTGIVANQPTLHRNTATNTEPNSTTISDSDHSAFNNVAFSNHAFDDENTFDSTATHEYETQAKADSISDVDSTAFSLPEISEQAAWSMPTQEEMSAQLANSPFLKVPSYEVDMLTDFDDQIALTAPTFDLPTAELASQTEVKATPTQMAEELLFPLDIYADETVSTEAEKDKADNQAPSKNDHDANIIEWELPDPKK